VGITQPTSVRPAITEVVASPIAKAAHCALTAGTSSENRCVIKPICGDNPNAIPAEASKISDPAKATLPAAAAPPVNGPRLQV